MATQQVTQRELFGQAKPRRGHPVGGPLFTDEQCRQIAAEYATGIGVTILARRYRVAELTVGRAVRRGGGTMRPNRNANPVSDDERAAIIVAYQGGKSTHSIEAQTGRSNETCRRMLVEAGIARRPRRKHALDQHYFDRIDTPAKARWLGFIAADGCVTVSTTCLCLKIGLEAADREHLLCLEADLSYEGPIPIYDRANPFGEGPNHKQRCPRAYLSIQSNTLCEALMRHGVGHRKSATLLPWTGDPELMRWWWAGYFDGDGGIAIPSRRSEWAFSLIGTKECMDAYADYITALTGSIVRPFAAKESPPEANSWRIQHSGLRLPQKIAQRFYSDQGGSTPLRRKQELADRLLAEEPRQADWSGMSIEDLLELHRQHGTWEAVASHLGTAKYNIQSLAERREVHFWHKRPELTAQKLLDLLAEHGSWNAAADAIGMTRKGLCAIRHDRGLISGRRAWRHLTADKLREMHAELQNWKAVATALRIRAPHLWRLRRRLGML